MSNMQSSTATHSSAGSQACAVCKYQRRKCTNNCLLAPFFPANRHKDFLNTRKLFGVRNIVKLIENLNFQQQAIAIKTIIFEANMKATDPVGGCYRFICELNKQIDRLKAELNLVNQQLVICKAQSMFTQYQQEQQQPSQKHVVVDNDQEQVNVVVGQNLEGFNIFDGGGSSSLWSAYDVFDSNLVKFELEASNIPACKQVLSDVGEEIKPLFADKRGQTFSFQKGIFSHEDIKPLLPLLDDKREQTFRFDSGGSKIKNSDKLEWKGRAGSIQHQLKLDLSNAASPFTPSNGKE